MVVQLINKGRLCCDLDFGRILYAFMHVNFKSFAMCILIKVY